MAPLKSVNIPYMVLLARPYFVVYLKNLSPDLLSIFNPKLVPINIFP